MPVLQDSDGKPQPALRVSSLPAIGLMEGIRPDREEENVNGAGQSVSHAFRSKRKADTSCRLWPPSLTENWLGASFPSRIRLPHSAAPA
jgi:hypothetical protein